MAIGSFDRHRTCAPCAIIWLALPKDAICTDAVACTGRVKVLVGGNRVGFVRDSARRMGVYLGPIRERGIPDHLAFRKRRLQHAYRYYSHVDERRQDNHMRVSCKYPEEK